MRSKFQALAVILCGLVSVPAVSQSAAVPTCFENDLPTLRAALDRDPENAGLRIRLTQALLRAGKDTVHPDVASARVKEAQGHFERVLSAVPKAPIPLRVQALDSYITNKFDQTVLIGKKLLEVVPTDAEVSRHVIKGLMRLKKQDEAAEFLTKWFVSGTIPSFGSMQGLLSTLLLDTKFRDVFTEKLGAACKAEPSDVYLSLAQAMLFAECGRLESAWDAVHAAEALGLCDTRTGARHTFVSMLKSRSPEVQQGSAHYDGLDLEGIESRLAANPTHAGLVMRQARLKDLGGKVQDALAGYAAVRKLNASFWPAYYRAGELLLDDKDVRPAEAAALFTEARALFPEYAPGWLREAEALIRSNGSGKAFDLLLMLAAKHEPSDGIERVYRLLLPLDEGSGLSTFLARLDTAISADPRNASLHAHRAMALVVLGRKADAISAAQMAEKCGLSGRDGYPFAVLYLAYDRPNPNKDSKTESSSAR